MGHRELVRYLLDFGQEEFAATGGLGAMVHVIGEAADVIATPGEDAPGHVADWMPGAVLGLVAAVRGQVAGFVAEAWMRVEPSAEELARYRRGTLARREAGGDPSVATVLLGGAVSRTGMTFEVREYRRRDDGTLRWQRVEPDGAGGIEGGALPEGLRDAFARGCSIEPPPEGVAVEAAVGMVLTLSRSQGALAPRV